MQASILNAQHDAFVLMWCIAQSHGAARKEMLAYRARVRRAACARVKLAMKCQASELSPRVAMQLLNITVEVGA